MRHICLLTAAAVAAACSSQSGQAGEPVETPSKSIERAMIRGDGGEVIAYAPFAHRNVNDLVPGCDGMNPDQRPRGSNCHGIFPEQCGADLVEKYSGKTLTASRREEIIGFSPTRDARFVHEGDALIEDLRFGRLNVKLDDEDFIRGADCF